MRRWELHHYKDWELRARVTHINKALRGCDANPGATANAMRPGLEGERNYIREEIKRRKTEREKP